MILGGALTDLGPAALVLALVAPTCSGAIPAGGAGPGGERAVATARATTDLEVAAVRLGGDLALRVDRVAVPAGDLVVGFSNDTEVGARLLVYPLQDVSALLMLERGGTTTVATRSYLKDVVGSTDVTLPGGRTTLTMAAVPAGLYELSTYERLLRPDGTVVVTHDAGESVTLAVTGAGGPATSIAEPTDRIAATMRAGDHGTWLIEPDHLVAWAGRVTFILRNEMDDPHDLAVAPLGDVSGFLVTRLAEGRADYEQIHGTELVSDLPPGRTISAAITLAPGTYVAACYMVSKDADGRLFIHADRGQRFTFRVV